MNINLATTKNLPKKTLLNFSAVNVERASGLPGTGAGRFVPGRFLLDDERAGERLPGQHPLRRPLQTQDRGAHSAEPHARAQVALRPVARLDRLRPRVQQDHHSRAPPSHPILRRQLSRVRTTRARTCSTLVFEK